MPRLALPRANLLASRARVGLPARRLTRPASSFPPPEPAIPTLEFEPKPPPPKPSAFSLIYPFLLLSAITSLALNLSHSRQQATANTRHLSAQVSVLSTLVARLHRDRAVAGFAPWTAAEEEAVERELELVGLGRGKGKLAQEGAEVDKGASISWGEVLFGKKGKAYELDKDETDWDKVFTEADEREQARRRGVKEPEPAAAQVVAKEQPVVLAPAAVAALPPPSGPSKPAVYL